MSEDESRPAEPTPAAGTGPPDKPPGPKKSNSGLRSVVLAVLLLGAAVAAWSFLGRGTQPILPGSGQVVPPAAAPPALPMPKVRSRVPAVAMRRDATGPLTAPVSNADGRPRTAKGDPLADGALRALEARVADLERVLAKLSMAPVGGGGRAADAHLVTRLSELEQRVDVAEQRGTGPATSLAFSLGLLRSAIREGRPFANDLDRTAGLTAKIGGPGSHMIEAINQLRGYAASGVPTPAALSRQLNAAAGAILSAAADRTDGNWTDRVRARLASVITVRRTDDHAGETPEARIARAEARLREGDVPAAIGEISRLEGAAASAASAWLAAARAQTAVEGGLRVLEAALSTGISAPDDGGN